MKNRIIRLIKILGEGYDEIIVDIIIGDINISTIEIVGSEYYVNIWQGDYEISLSSDQLDVSIEEQLVKELEKML